MNLTVLAASGRTGIALTRQALRRGHTVTAIARDPQRIDLGARVSRETVAAAMLDEAEAPGFPGVVALPLAE